MRLHDVAVFGGGPAGAALARDLRLRGRTVLLIARDASDASTFETVSGGVERSLRALRVRTRFLGLRPRICTGRRSLWGAGPTVSRSSLLDAGGRSFHVDRGAFDRMLIAAAIESGAEMARAARTVNVQRAGGEWRVETGDGPARARWLVDATGRKASLVRALGHRWQTIHDQVALVAHAGRRADAVDVDDALVVESAGDRDWWYSLPSGNGQRVVGFVTRRLDDDWRARGRRRVFMEALARRDTICALVRTDSVGEPVARPASHGAAEQVCGEGWTAIGDAAMAPDPLSGQGVSHALSSALEASEAVDAALDDDHAPMSHLASRWFARRDEHGRARRRLAGLAVRAAPEVST